MSKNRFRYQVYKILDYPADKAPKGFIQKIVDIAEYRDQLSREHMYSDETIRVYMEENPDEFTKQDRAFLSELLKIVDEHQCGFIRFIF